MYETVFCYTISFYFYQAEDGIRDTSVTGVQTCALPISSRRRSRQNAPDRSRRRRPGAATSPRCCRKEVPRRRRDRGAPRSEERRVGNECDDEWATYR